MSFLDDIVDFASGAFSWFTGSSATAGLARTALTGYALNRVTASVVRENEAVRTADLTPPVDPGVRLQVNPDTEHRIPVVYGSAYLGGIVTDAFLTNSNQTLYKIGITNLTVQRRFPIIDLARIRVIKTWSFEVGIEAAEREDSILRKFSDDIYTGPNILVGAGNTELFIRDVLDLDSGTELQYFQQSSQERFDF